MKTSFFVALLAVLSLPACDRLSLQNPTAEPAAIPAFAAAAARGPYLQVLVNDSGASAVLARETFRDDIATWLAEDGTTVSTDSAGFLLATRGLGGDMIGTDARESRALVLSRRPGRATRLHSFYDFDNKSVQRAYICDITRQAPAPLALSSGTITAQIMVEDCASADQQFLNVYWLNAAGRIVQSSQWGGDFAGTLTFRIVP